MKFMEVAEQLLLDFFNSDVPDHIINEYLGLLSGEPIPKEDLTAREEVARKHIKKFLQERKSACQ